MLPPLPMEAACFMWDASFFIGATCFMWDGVDVLHVGAQAALMACHWQAASGGPIMFIARVQPARLPTVALAHHALSCPCLLARRLAWSVVRIRLLVAGLSCPAVSSSSPPRVRLASPASGPSRDPPGLACLWPVPRPTCPRPPLVRLLPSAARARGRLGVRDGGEGVLPSIATDFAACNSPRVLIEAGGDDAWPVMGEMQWTLPHRSSPCFVADRRAASSTHHRRFGWFGSSFRLSMGVTTGRHGCRRWELRMAVMEHRNLVLRRMNVMSLP
ncbi:hypothetical protein ACLOJK_012853 [Asimina triloba]